MDVDVPRAFAAAAMDPSPAVVQRLATIVAAELSRPADDDAVTEVALDDVPSLGAGRVSRRGLAVVSVAAALVAATVGLAVARSRSSQQPVTPSVTTGATASTASTAVPPTNATVATTSPQPASLPPTTVGKPPPAPAVSAAWEPLPDGPLAGRRFNPLVVAMGDLVFVAGGHSPAAGNAAPDLRDGAVLNAAGTAWHHIADSPVPVGGDLPAAWTGTELVVIGAEGGAWAYAPAIDRWRQIVSALPGRLFASTAWTGTELLVAGGLDPTAPRAGDQGGGWARASGAFALNPATGARRTLPAPGGADDLAGPGVWTGREWVRAAAPLESAEQPTPPANRVGAFDPATARWRPLPALPDGADVSVLASVGDDLVAFDANATRWRLVPDATVWRREGALPDSSQTSVRAVWTVAGLTVVDTGSESTNGRFVGYRQASGAWQALGAPTVGNGDTIVQLASGGLVGTDGRLTSRLRPISDPTARVPACRPEQVRASVGTWAGGAVVVVTNRSATPCTVSGQRPTDVEFRRRDTWMPQTASASLGQHAGAGGGLLAPNQQALMDVEPWMAPVPDAPCAVAGPVDAVRFSLSLGGDPVTVELTTDERCPDLSALAALPRAPASPIDAVCAALGPAPAPGDADASLLVSIEGVGFASGLAGRRIIFTNVGTASCRLPSSPRLQAAVSEGGPWIDAVSPTNAPDEFDFLRPVDTVGPGEFAEIAVRGLTSEFEPDQQCPPTDPAPRELPVAYRLVFDAGRVIELPGFTMGTYRCNMRISMPGRQPPGS